MSEQLIDAPRRDSEAATRRVQVEFSPEAFRKLLEIKELSEASSNAEVIRDAIRLYDWFLQQKRENYKFQLVKGNKVKEVELVLT